MSNEREVPTGADDATGPLRLHVELEKWPLVTPFQVTGHTFRAIEVLVVSLECNGLVGRGEGAGVYYKNDRPSTMKTQIESLRATIEAGLSRQAVQDLLAAGGARNALDCALWDLQAKLAGYSVWQIAGLQTPQRLLTTFTCGAAAPDSMAAAARAYAGSKAIKLKLTGEPVDAERVRAVRDARPDVWLGVDANQGFTRRSLEQLMPVLESARVKLIEQPFPIGQEALLDGFLSPIPIAADESVQCLADIDSLVGRFDMLNIKLDKCGGLTQGLKMAKAAGQRGLETMVGNMMGTSLAMAPAFLVGQHCKVVDLDGPIFQKEDRGIPVQYSDGYIMCPEALWGGTAPSRSRSLK